MRALVAAGYGINCEKEMAYAAALAGAKTEIRHVRELIDGNLRLNDYQLLMFPGGFSFGDELGSGKALAGKLSSLVDKLHAFVAQGNSILGVCNGFQLLCKLGLLGQAALDHNLSGKFENRWVTVKACPSPSIFTQGLATLYLPIRHGEGRCLMKDCKTALKYEPDCYPNNPNGSESGAAALTDETGRILGMMPHPEAALFFTNRPDWTQHKHKCRQSGDGQLIFQNVARYYS